MGIQQIQYPIRALSNFRILLSTVASTPSAQERSTGFMQLDVKTIGTHSLSKPEIHASWSTPVLGIVENKEASLLWSNFVLF